MADEKRSDPKKEQKSGFPQISAIHVVIAAAVVILAVIFIAKFGFGMDLISSSSGEMAIAKPRPVTPVPATIQKDVAIRPSISIRPDMLPSCDAPKTLCGDTCTDIQTNVNNCGACGNDCTTRDVKNVAEFGCANAKCTITSCQPGYGDCMNKGTIDVNGDGCETNLKTSESWIYNQYSSYVYQQKDPESKVYLENPANCGSCGNKCEGGSTFFGICDNGACRKVCWGTWLNCDNSWSNGCEQAFDDNNCGACGAKCPADSFCNNGCCVLKSDHSKAVADSLGVTCSGNIWVRQSK